MPATNRSRQTLQSQTKQTPKVPLQMVRVVEERSAIHRRGVTRVKDSPPDRKGDVAVSSAEVEAAPEAAPAENKTAGNPLSRNAVDLVHVSFELIVRPQPSPRSSPEPASRDLYDTS